MRARLLSRVQRRFDVVRERVKIGTLELDFVRVADPDRVLDQVAEEEDRREKSAGRRLEGEELHLPYWAQLWDSAMGVACWLESGLGRRAIAQGGDVLDLGCGMGLAGTVAAALGARVLFADLEAPALLFAALNSLPWRRRVWTRRMNWRSDELGDSFDLIVGADILYERGEWEHLDRFWRSHLKGGGSVLLGEPGRQTGDAFVEWVGPRGWKLDRYQQPLEKENKTIRVLRLTAAGAQGAAEAQGASEAQGQAARNRKARRP